ncbi:MAG: TetR family transcriptional regulator [Novosphingobium sp.]|nr:TetR family transcriptional regulator [Novosphingobium sp.]
MGVAQRKRHDPRREATRAALIEAAETMFAEAGVEGVSTRQIAAAIGSSNNNVISYHFGSKEDLIEAIYRHRLPQIDARRHKLLQEADAAGRGHDLAPLMRALWLPLFEQTNEAGQHSYACFLASLGRLGMSDTRYLVSPDFPETTRVADRIAMLLPGEVASQFDIRMRAVASMIFTTLQLIDREALGNSAEAERMFGDAIAMATAAIAAPASSDPALARN